MTVNLGTDTFGRGAQISDRLRSRGLQHAILGRSRGMGTNCRLGIYDYDRPMSVSARLIQRGKQMETFKLTGRMGADRPWYEAFFEHIETVAPVASQLVLQIYDMRYDQQRAAWNQASADQRDKAYLDMFKSMASQKTTGQGTMNAQTQSFLLEQFRNEPSSVRQSTVTSIAGGDQNVANALLGLVTPWYEKPIVWVGIGGAVLAGVTIVGLLATR